MQNSIKRQFTMNISNSLYTSKKLLLSLVTIIFSFGSYSQIVTIPDGNFKTYLVGNAAINTNGDAEIQVSEASVFTGQIFCSNLGINDLTGIEAFIALTDLTCNSNQLTSINLSQNTALTFLTLNLNQLTSLDLSQNTALVTILCHHNLLANITLGSNSVLNLLHTYSNQLTSLDVTQNTALTVLYCFDNQITGIDVTQNTMLIQLYVNENQLSGIDVSQNADLLWLYCNDNPITSLDVSQNLNLTKLYCYNNQLTSLDVTQNVDLTQLYCLNNSLTSLNAANGNNTNFTVFNTTINPNLTCIEVDDATWSTANWTDIDPASSFSNDCNPICIVNIPDANFKTYLVGNAAINTNGDAEIQCSEASAFTGFISCSSLGIVDLTGIEAFTSLTGLDCGYNSISAINRSLNTSLTMIWCNNNSLTSLILPQSNSLTNLNCSTNSLTSLNVTQNTALEYLTCSINSLTSLDLNQNLVLITLNCSSNLLTSLNVNNNTNLTDLVCYNNQLPSLDVSQNIQLTTLDCHNNSISSIDVVQNVDLITFYCHDNSLSSLNVTQNIDLLYFHCYSNSISLLDVSQNSVLVTLFCQSNALSSLDVTQNLDLTALKCFGNSLTSLDISQNIVLIQIYCHFNQLTSLNAANGNNTNFTAFYANNNPNLTCIQVDDDVWSTANWTNIDAIASFSNNCLIAPPTAACQDVTIGLDAFGNVTLLPSMIDGGSSSNSGVYTLSADVVNFDCSDMGANTVTLTVTSDGLSSTCSATVTVIDDIDPTGTLQSTITVDCFNNVPVPDPLIITDEADNCSGPLSVIFVSDVSDGGLCPEVITRTYAVADYFGNTIFLTQAITIQDISAPTASNPVTINVGCIGEVPAPDVLVVTDEADNCSLNPIVVFNSDVSNGLTNPETITRTYLVEDDCGNMILVTQLIIVEDLTAPFLDAPILLDAQSNCSINAPGNYPTATDNCDGTITGVPNISFPITTIGTTVVTWTYSDANGNISTQTQDFTVIDNLAPVPDATALTDLVGECNIDAPTTPTATDNCGGVITGTPSLIFPITAIGLTVITWSFDDGNGNTSTQTQDAWNTPIVFTSTITVSGNTLTSDEISASYQWVDCDNGNAEIFGETSQSFTPVSTGNYAVQLTRNGCVEITPCIYFGFVGLDENELSNGVGGLSSEVEIYPNPATYQITIDTDEQVGTVMIFDLFGSLVQQENTTTFSVENLSSGVYIMNIKTNNGISLNRFIKK